MINLVVALRCEAGPLVQACGMTRDRAARGFRVYRGEGARLVVTGVGRANAAAGTAYLAGMEPTADAAWVNVGVAGHRSLSPGSGTFAVKITDRITRRNWYPPQITGMPGAGVHVMTFEQPVSDYPEDLVCDMEAAAFYASATRFAPAELVQCYKVISDNESVPATELTAASVEGLIGGHVDAVAAIVSSLRALLAGLPDRIPTDGELAEFKRWWHLTASQQLQLSEILRRLAVAAPAAMRQAGKWRHCADAKRLLAEMSRCADALFLGESLVTPGDGCERRTGVARARGR